MAIARFENVTINTLSASKTEFGEQTITQTKWFDTRGRVFNVSNPVKISDKYRVYSDLIHFVFNYTPNMKTIANNHVDYSLIWNGKEYRITEIVEANDRMTVKFMCYRNDPVTAV
jgi:hypothetical protein